MAAWRALYLGEGAPAAAFLEGCAAHDPWAGALHATRAHLTNETGEPPEAPDTMSLAGAVHRFELGQLRMRRLDRPPARAFALPADMPLELREHVALAHWLATIIGAAEPGPEPAAFEPHESTRVLGVLRVAYRALALERTGDLEAARKAARHASRMGRAESIPHAEHLAHLVLARVRRADGHPHLATHILTALARYVPPALMPWLRYELTLCAGPIGDRVAGGPSLDVDPSPLIVAPSHEALAEQGARLAEVAEPRPIVRGELASLRAMLDPSQPADDGTSAWLFGESADAPHGLHGTSIGADDAPYGLVLAEPGRRGRRVLSVSAERLGVTPSTLGKDRIDAAAAGLLLAGEAGVTVAPFFESVYGFGYKPKLHSGSLRQVLHRLRGSALPMTIERQGDRLHASATSRLLVHDPRCMHSVHDRILRFIATHPEVAAKEIASQLGMPARSAQRALSALVDEGWCQRVGSGPATAYRVEDTTFSEPTQA